MKEAEEEEQGVGARSEERRVAQRRVVHSHGAQDHDQEGHTQKHSGEAWDHVDLHLVSSVSVLDDQTIFSYTHTCHPQRQKISEKFQTQIG